MSQTLYRKYRPENFSQVIGQRHIVQTLANAVKNGRTGQAYLFTGPRGTGKTSIARIMAKTVNCQDLKGTDACGRCLSCKTIAEGRNLDIIEIDAASNTGVDNIRELRETVALPPTASRFKVYIIDEVHMLSLGAFNALLKTLEEPPSHVIFILATTEIHKVPETILSRCQRFDFSRLPIQSIIEKLALIAKSEKIKIDKDSLEMIAIAAEGGMRDAESLLSQVIALEDKNITLKEVEEILGTTDRSFSFELAEMLISKDTAGAIGRINTLLNDGYDLKVFTKSLINYLRQLMLLKVSPELKDHLSYEITGEQLEKMLDQARRAELVGLILAINLFLDAQGKISSFILPQLPLEIAIIKITRSLPRPEAFPEKKIPIEPVMKIAREDQPARDVPDIEEAREITAPEGSGSAPNGIIDQNTVESRWDELLVQIKPYNHSLRVLLANCRIASVKGTEITIATSYDFYKEKLNQNANRLTVEEVLGKILGLKISLKAVTFKEAGIPDTAKPAPSGSAPEDNPGEQESLLDSALEIIGGRVVEE